MICGGYDNFLIILGIFLAQSTTSKKKGSIAATTNPLILLKISGAEGQNRTADTGIFSPLLYRLSYLGKTLFLLLDPRFFVKRFLSHIPV